PHLRIAGQHRDDAIDPILVIDRQGLDERANSIRLLRIELAAIEVLQEGDDRLADAQQLALRVLARGELGTGQITDERLPAGTIGVLGWRRALYQRFFDGRGRRRQLPRGMQKLQQRDQSPPDKLWLGDGQLPETARSPALF